ncbi:MAG TPA: glycosyltransferase family 4 protein [Patescibacteria group bacterium]|nr:glycosyltransferase family 4 protein [Patescibacteria group bacterium]
MNILIINWQDIKNPFGGGAETHLHEIFKRIAARGHDVTLYCCEVPGLPREEVLDGIRIIREGNRNLFNFYVPLRYFSRFKKEHYDIIIDDVNKIPFYTPLYVREPLLGISHHFFGSSIFLEAGRIAGSYVYSAEKLVNVVYKKTPFAVVSESTLKEFLERGFPRENFTIIPNCITPGDFPMRVGEKNRVPTVTYFGRLKKYKSADHLVKAFAIVLKEIPKARLQILGTGDFRPELERLTKELQIEEEVKFFGFVSDEQKIELLSAAHCMVNPSMKEGWGITNIEANACGTPVISANVPGLRDSMSEGQNGLLYEYGDITGLARAIIRVLKNDALRQELSDGAVAWAKTFDWDDSATKMIELCERVIAGSKNSF